jgi:two-component SAPR family response regulator
MKDTTIKTYEVFFELFGKKMKTKVKARYPNEAKEIIKNTIIFHKITEEKFADLDDIFKNINEILK